MKQEDKKTKAKPLFHGKRRDLYLDDATVIDALKIGKGSISKGVRMAVEAYKFFNKPEQKNNTAPIDLSTYKIKHVKTGSHDE